VQVPGVVEIIDPEQVLRLPHSGVEQRDGPPARIDLVVP